MPGDEKTWAETVNAGEPPAAPPPPTEPAGDESRFVGGEGEAAALLRLLNPAAGGPRSPADPGKV